ncbi:MAG TPA: histone deacetylase [bacterium]|jgi:acetoin utilization deacetylase AcuC-like enzyme|nr:histone deacetylase [bacterium]
MNESNLKVLSSVHSGFYEVPGHPEHPMRVKESLKHLQTHLPNSIFEEPLPAPLEKIQVVHSPRVIQAVQNESFIDMDTPGAPGIYQASLLSAGSAIQASREALLGIPVFSLMRPPGHHATPDQSMGFCYFNSMAVAVNDLIKSGRAKRVAIFDLDCHHGNGTEAFCLGKPEYLYVSLHQGSGYPGTGLVSKDNSINYPLPIGTKEGVYFPAMESAMEKIRLFKPDVVGVSMGFDTYEHDPLTEFGLKQADYLRMGKMLQSMNVPMFALLEGGYDKDLPILIEKFLIGWTS